MKTSEVIAIKKGAELALQASNETSVNWHANRVIELCDEVISVSAERDSFRQTMLGLGVKFSTLQAAYKNATGQDYQFTK